MSRDEQKAYLENIQLQPMLVGLVANILRTDQRPTTNLELISHCKTYFETLAVGGIQNLEKTTDKSHAKILLDHVLDQHKDQHTHQKLVQALVSSVGGVQWVSAAAMYYYDKSANVEKDFDDIIFAETEMKGELPNSEDCKRFFTDEKRFETLDKLGPIVVNGKTYRQEGTFKDDDTIQFERKIDGAADSLLAEKEGLIFENCRHSNLIMCTYYKGASAAAQVLRFTDMVAQSTLRAPLELKM